MKRIILSSIIALLFFTVVSAAWYASKFHHVYTANFPAHAAAPVIDHTVNEKLHSVGLTANQYAAAHQFNTAFCFLVDMSVASGRQRFFVYDMKNKNMLISGLVTHGCCNQNWLTGRKYGNTAGCGCTSLGKYKVGNPYQGKFGLAYKLYGLEGSNSNAYNRFVVLHSMQCVPEHEVDPYPICQSDGCPTVSPGFLKELAPLINNSHKPVLLWIYE